MSIAYVDEFSVTREHESLRPLLSPEAIEGGRAMRGLASDLIAQHLDYEADEQSAFFDPLEGLSVLKYHLIGDPRVVARYNLTFPPGVARRTARGGRVYGVECAALVEPGTGWVEILRKDDIVDSADPTDWMLARYNTRTGEYQEPHIITVTTDKGVAGDTIRFRIDPPGTDYRYANQGPSTLAVTLDRMYHATGEMVSTRQVYYGRGTGQEPPLVEATYSHDISLLFGELERQMQEAGLPPEILDRGARLRPGTEREYGRHILHLDTWGSGM